MPSATGWLRALPDCTSCVPSTCKSGNRQLLRIIACSGVLNWPTVLLVHQSWQWQLFKLTRRRTGAQTHNAQTHRRTDAQTCRPAMSKSTVQTAIARARTDKHQRSDTRAALTLPTEMLLCRTWTENADYAKAEQLCNFPIIFKCQKSSTISEVSL